ncbi:MAG TPA: hypothetical protein VH186_16610 [Chloroflexia bacterium]|nr:hypothetical protein [Chloroflexia bacterium]
MTSKVQPGDLITADLINNILQRLDNFQAILDKLQGNVIVKQFNDFDTRIKNIEQRFLKDWLATQARAADVPEENVNNQVASILNSLQAKNIFTIDDATNFLKGPQTEAEKAQVLGLDNNVNLASRLINISRNM